MDRLVSTVAVIGVGRIGLRHLQGVMSVGDAEIWVVDPSSDALTRARAEFTGVAEHRVPPTFATDVRDLPASIDVAIVATSADIRRAMVEDLLHGRDVRHIVLEKVLFQRLADY